MFNISVTSKNSKTAITFNSAQKFYNAYGFKAGAAILEGEHPEIFATPLENHGG